MLSRLFAYLIQKQTDLYRRLIEVNNVEYLVVLILRDKLVGRNESFTRCGCGVMYTTGRV